MLLGESVTNTLYLQGEVLLSIPFPFDMLCVLERRLKHVLTNTLLIKLKQR